MQMADESNTKMLRKWEVLKGVDGKQLEEIKFFHGFQTYTGDKQKRNSCAIFLTTNDEVFVVGHNNEDNLLALTGNDFGKQVVVKKPRKIEALSGKNIRKIVVNERFGTALTEDGKLLYWGTNMRQLQYEAHDPKYVSEPFEPNPDVRVADMACGAHSITLVTDENKVFIWGCINLYYSSFYQFEKIELRRDVQVKGISCGWGHVALLDQKGQVWTFGTGTVGQLGYAKDRGQLFDEIVPKKVSLPQPCTKVECGYYSTLYLLKNGELYASGSNGKSDHLCVGKSGYVFNPVKVLLDDSLSDIAATFAWSSGRWQSLYAAVSKDGMKYYEWGNDKKLEKPRISEGAQSIMEVFSNFKTPQSIGELVRVDVVQLQGPGIGKSEPKPQSFANRSILNRWTFLEGIDEDFKRNISFFTVFEGSFDNRHVFGAFMKTENTDNVYHWGYKGRGKLGLSSNKEEITPEKVESLSGKNIKKIFLNFQGGVALSNDNSLYVWDLESSPDTLKGKVVTDVASGINFYVYTTREQNSTIKVYLDGQMSTNFSKVSHQEIQFSAYEKPVEVSAGAWHFLVRTNASNVYAFGDGRYGQLGVEWKKNNEEPLEKIRVELPGPVKKIMCGTASSFFLTEKGELFACGTNSYADPLGVGHAKAVYKPEKVKIDEKVVDVAASMRTNEFGGRISTFAVKAASGKIYKCEGGKEKPEELVNTKFLVEAFADEEIPQSLSLVRLLSDPDDEDLTDIELRGPISSGVTPEKTLFNDPLFSDVTIKLKDGVIASHKVLLHIKSQFFRKALSSNEVDDQEELDLVSYNSKAVRALLMHIYDLPIGQHATDLNDVIEFVNLAKEDGNPELILIAEDILLKNMVFSLYLAGDSNVPLPTSENTMKELRDFIESSVFPHGSSLS